MSGNVSNGQQCIGLLRIGGNSRNLKNFEHGHTALCSEKEKRKFRVSAKQASAILLTIDRKKHTSQLVILINKYISITDVTTNTVFLSFFTFLWCYHLFIYCLYEVQLITICKVLVYYKICKVFRKKKKKNFKLWI